MFVPNVACLFSFVTKDLIARAVIFLFVFAVVAFVRLWSLLVCPLMWMVHGGTKKNAQRKGLEAMKIVRKETTSGSAKGDRSFI